MSYRLSRRALRRPIRSRGVPPRGEGFSGVAPGRRVGHHHYGPDGVHDGGYLTTGVLRVSDRPPVYLEAGTTTPSAASDDRYPARRSAWRGPSRHTLGPSPASSSRFA